MQRLTDQARQRIGDIAARHGFGDEAAMALMLALDAGGGTQAQFSHPELGGMGQWSPGGMIMIGDMFNTALKYRVDALCSDLAAVWREGGVFAAPAPGADSSRDSGRGGGWPAELGAPSASGAQNDMAYAVFPATRRLAIRVGGRTTIYDTGDHAIGGLAQAQGGGQSLTLTSQAGPVRVDDLAIVSGGAGAAAGGAPVDATPAGLAPAMAAADRGAPDRGAHRHDAPARAASGWTAAGGADAPGDAATDGAGAGASVAANVTDDAIFSRLERLADLRAREVITAEEFAAKKAELLARL